MFTMYKSQLDVSIVTRALTLAHNCAVYVGLAALHTYVYDYTQTIFCLP